jgi:hypothetical protein
VDFWWTFRVFGLDSFKIFVFKYFRENEQCQKTEKQRDGQHFWTSGRVLGQNPDFWWTFGGNLDFLDQASVKRRILLILLTRLKITSVITRAALRGKLAKNCRPLAVKSMQCCMPAYATAVLKTFNSAGQGCRARLLSKAGRQGCRARLPGKAAGQGCRARLPGKAAEQGCRARLPGKAAGQGCRTRLPGKVAGPGKAAGNMLKAWTRVASRSNATRVKIIPVFRCFLKIRDNDSSLLKNNSVKLKCVKIFFF